MKKVNLVNAATEFNKVVKLQEPIQIKGNSDLAKDLFSALIHIMPSDHFSEKSEKVFKELKKQFVENTVEVGTTVTLDADKKTNKISKTNKMAKQAKKDAKGATETKVNPSVELIAAILDPKVTKETLVGFIESEKVFKKAKADLLKVTNFMSLKKQMLENFDEEQVKEIRAAMPKPERKPKTEKAPKVDPIIAVIEAAEDLDDLKVVAKGDDRFNWKELKGLKKVKKIRKAMLEIVESSKPAKKEPAAPKMIPNPIIAEIEGFGKLKKLKAWVEEQEDIELPKKLKKYEDLEDLKAALLEIVPAEIAQKAKRKSSGNNSRPGVVATIRELVDGASKKKGISKSEILEVLVEKFPDRDADSMKNTVNLHVPSMIKKEHGWDIVKLDNGNYYRKS